MKSVEIFPVIVMSLYVIVLVMGTVFRIKKWWYIFINIMGIYNGNRLSKYKWGYILGIYIYINIYIDINIYIYI